MEIRNVAARQVKAFADLFVEERSHFYTKRSGQAGFIHQDLGLSNHCIRQHLEGRWWVAVIRAEATKILSLDLDCKGGPDPEGAMLKRYDRIRRLMPEPVVFHSSNSRGLHLYWLLAEEVPRAAAVSLMARALAERKPLTGGVIAQGRIPAMLGTWRRLGIQQPHRQSESGGHGRRGSRRFGAFVTAA